MNCSCRERWTFIDPHSGGYGCPVTQEEIDNKDLQNYITGLDFEIARLHKVSRNDPDYNKTDEWRQTFNLISELEILFVDLRFYLL